MLELANRLVPKLGGSAKTLRPTLDDGPVPEVQPNADIVARIRELVANGVPLEEQAVLVRTNARAADFEEEFHDAGIPFQGASLLARDAARQLLKMLSREAGSAGEAVRRIALAQGWLEDPPEKLGEREQTRQADLARLIRLAEQFDGGPPEFAASLRERFGASAGRGVFLPWVEEGELPSRRAKGDDLLEERRLLYVGLTRAKRHLVVTWSGKPSRFLEELGVQSRNAVASAKPKLEQTPAVLALKEWRLARARAEEVPAYVVFNDRTLAELVARSPTTLAELAAVPGIGPAKLERFGPELLAALARAA